MPPSAAELTARLKQAAFEEGFDMAAAAPLEPPPHAEHLDRWLAAGHAGGMGWLERNRDLRRDPRRLRPFTRSILTVGLGYRQHGVPHEMLTDPSRGRIAMYAWGRDYHKIMGKALKRLGRRASELAERPVEFSLFVDTGPVLERPLASAAHLGFIGKHTLLINKRLGSWFFLGELLLDAELVQDEAPPVTFGCGDCTRCGEICPTGALDVPYENRAPLCISYLTIEHRGPIPRDLRPKMGNWVFGCDLCQQTCPYNARMIPETREARFRPGDPRRAAPKLADLVTMDEEAFRALFSGSAVTRTKRAGLARNAAVALGNWGSDEAVAPLVRALGGDPAPLVRGHAVWALGRIGGREARAALERAREADDDAGVAAEIEWALEGGGKE